MKITWFKRLSAGTLAGLALALLAACGQQVLDSMVDDKDDARARDCIQKLFDGDFDWLEKNLADDLRTPTVRDTFGQMRDILPKAKPASLKLVGVNDNRTHDSRFINLTYEHGFDGQWFVINCAFHEQAGTVRIAGLHVNETADSLERMHRFELGGKSPSHYVMLAAMVAAVGITLLALVLCAREKGLRRKWAWVLFILFGFVSLMFDWTTGAWMIQPLSFLVFSAGAFWTPYGPVLLKVAVPVGALVYLIRRVRNQNPPPQSNPEPTGS